MSTLVHMQYIHSDMYDLHWITGIVLENFLKGEGKKFEFKTHAFRSIFQQTNIKHFENKTKQTMNYSVVLKFVHQCLTW